jgi:hypothetical protein
MRQTGRFDRRSSGRPHCAYAARYCALTTHLRHFTARSCVASCGKRIWLFAVATLQYGMAAAGARPALAGVLVYEGAAAVTQVYWRCGRHIPELDCAARAALTATSVTRFLGSSPASGTGAPSQSGGCGDRYRSTWIARKRSVVERLHQCCRVSPLERSRIAPHGIIRPIHH